MPSTKPFVLPPLRGEPPFAQWVADLEAAVSPPNRSELIAMALAALAERHGVRPPPRRTPRHGTNRHGEPAS